MEELLRALQNADDGTWGDLLSQRDTVSLLDHVASSFAGASAGEVDALWGAAERVWALLTSDQLRAGMRWCCRGDVPGRVFRGADADALRKASLNHFCAAMVIGHLRHLSEPSRWAATYLWLSHFATVHESPLPVGSASPDWAQSTFPDRVRFALALLPPPGAGHLRVALDHFLPDHSPRPAHTVTVYFPTCNDAGAGNVYRLELRELAEGGCGLYRSHACFGLPLAADLLEVLRRAYERHHPFAGPVVWSLERLDRSGGVCTVSGNSPTAAACVGFRALFERREVDSGCLISACFDPGDTPWNDPNPVLREVTGLPQKCEAACRCPNPVFDRLIFNTPGFLRGCADFRDNGRALTLVRAATLDDAYRSATPLADELRRFYECARGLLDRDTPAYLGPRRLSDLYIEPDVLRDVVRLEPALAEPAEKGASSTGSKESPSADLVRQLKLEAEDESEEKYRDKEVARRERVSWARVWRTTRSAVIIGDPGEGKSILARHLLRELAAIGLQELEACRTPAPGLTTPVFIRLADLAGAAELKTAIRAWILDLTAGGAHFSEALVSHVASAALGPCGTIILDGLDEVPAEGRRAVSERLSFLSECPCRVILTSRPYGYQRGGVPFAELDQFELAPLDTHQRRGFVEQWFRGSGAPDWRERVLQLVAGAGLGTMSQNAFLLTLICAEAELRDLPPGTRRPKLYEWIIRDLIRGAWRHVPPPIPARDARLDAQIMRLQPVCWRLTEGSPARYAFTRIEWFRALESTGYSLDQAADLLNAWQERGVLIPLLVRRPSGEAEGWAFAHRSILEYLAAAHVAASGAVAAIDRYLWVGEGESKTWTPDAQDLIPFVAGCMENPTPLLRRLVELDCDEPDALYVMARLAARCLADANLEAVDSSLRDEVLSRAEKAYHALGRTQTLAQCFRHAAGVEYLERRLAQADRTALLHLLKLVGQVGPVAATPALLNLLLTQATRPPSPPSAKGAANNTSFRARELSPPLPSAAHRASAERARAHDPDATHELAQALSADQASQHDHEITREALRALQAIGSAAATPAILDRLAHMLQAGVEGAFPEAVEILTSLGEAAKRPDIVDELRKRVQAGSSWARTRALEALCALGVPATADLAEAFGSEIVRSGNSDARPGTVEAARWLADKLATPEVLRGLIAKAMRAGGLSFLDTQTHGRMDALEVLGAFGTAGATAAVPEGLVALAVRDQVPAIRTRAVEVLRGMGPAAAHEVLPHLLVALQSDDGRIRAQAAEALGNLPAASRPDVIDALHNLPDDDWFVRSAALAALVRLGGSCDRTEAISALVAALRGEDPFARKRAAQAVAAIGVTAATPEVLEALAALTGTSNETDRLYAVEALGAMGRAARDHLAALVRALGDSDLYVRVAAAGALGAMGPVAATPDVLSSLVALMKDRSQFLTADHICRAALRALRAMGPAAARADVIGAVSDIIAPDSLWYGGARQDAAEALEQLLGTRAFLPRVPHGGTRDRQRGPGGPPPAAEVGTRPHPDG